MVKQGSWDEDGDKFIPESGVIFVFGSNLAGRHGRGAALFARNYYGAIYGQGIGRQGNSYAIPTKDYQIRTLPLLTIKTHVVDFLEYAKEFIEQPFKMTRIGCGLAGYKDYQMAPMFQGVSSNVIIPVEWKSYLGTR